MGEVIRHRITISPEGFEKIMSAESSRLLRRLNKFYILEREAEDICMGKQEIVTVAYRCCESPKFYGDGNAVFESVHDKRILEKLSYAVE